MKFTSSQFVSSGFACLIENEGLEGSPLLRHHWHKVLQGWELQQRIKTCMQGLMVQKPGCGVASSALLYCAALGMSPLAGSDCSPPVQSAEGVRGLCRRLEADEWATTWNMKFQNVRQSWVARCQV